MDIENRSYYVVQQQVKCVFWCFWNFPESDCFGV